MTLQNSLHEFCREVIECPGYWQIFGVLIRDEKLILSLYWRAFITLEVRSVLSARYEECSVLKSITTHSLRLCSLQNGVCHTSATLKHETSQGSVIISWCLRDWSLFSGSPSLVCHNCSRASDVDNITYEVNAACVIRLEWKEILLSNLSLPSLLDETGRRSVLLYFLLQLVKYMGPYFERGGKICPYSVKCNSR